ncbi:MAG: hypothetical protein VKJ64_07370 [Leptolyngbyaceae bacterium]|nr:hypothetical protein [Leptolyngbyaceae bacterium]
MHRQIREVRAIAPSTFITAANDRLSAVESPPTERWRNATPDGVSPHTTSG